MIKRFFYLGDYHDFPIGTHDKDQNISLVSSFSLDDFIDMNRKEPFDLLLLCGRAGPSIISDWFERLAGEVHMPGVMISLQEGDSPPGFLEDYPFYKGPVFYQLGTGEFWEALSSSAVGRTAGDYVANPDPGDNLSYGLIGCSPQIRNVRCKIHKYATCRSLSLLITGENGTGKELVARAVHFEGHGPETPFVAVQPSSIGADLLESSLFGVSKGAFTGSEPRRGLMEMARGGVLFMDEIGTLSPSCQASLLRVLQERKIRPLGSSKEIDTDFRLLTATNEDLSAGKREHVIREDLYHRIAALVIEIPPLRERKEDIPLLAEYFLGEGEGKGFSTRALRKLAAHDWPGNVRELENTVARALAESEKNRIIESRDILLL